MIKQFKKISLVMLIALFSYSFAASSFKTTFTGITKATLNNADGSSINSGGNNLDGLGIEMKATVDNVTGVVNIAKDTVGGTVGVLKFSSAYLEVKDVLDGMLTFKFYDIGYGAGKGNVARVDKGVHGIKVTIKPIDILSIGIGYGVNSDALANSQGSLASVQHIGQSVANDDYHAVSLDLGVNLDLLPFTIYVGAILTDVEKTFAYISPIPVTGSGPPIGVITTKASKIQLLQAGLTMDALAAVKPGALKIDFGAAFAGSQVTDFIASTNKIATGTATNDIELETALAMAVVVYGGVADLAPGLGLDYYLHFSPDSMTKYTSLGDLDDETFAELIKFSITPSYTLGQFKFALGLGFKRYGENASRYFKQLSGKDNANISVNAVDVDPSVTWTPAAGMSVNFFYNLDMLLSGDSIYSTTAGLTDVSYADREKAIDHTIGMKVVLALNVANE